MSCEGRMRSRRQLQGEGLSPEEEEEEEAAAVKGC